MGIMGGLYVSIGGTISTIAAAGFTGPGSIGESNRECLLHLGCLELSVLN